MLPPHPCPGAVHGASRQLLGAVIIRLTEDKQRYLGAERHAVVMPTPGSVPCGHSCGCGQGPHGPPHNTDGETEAWSVHRRPRGCPARPLSRAWGWGAGQSSGLSGTPGSWCRLGAPTSRNLTHWEARKWDFSKIHASVVSQEVRWVCSLVKPK